MDLTTIGLQSNRGRTPFLKEEFVFALKGYQAGILNDILLRKVSGIRLEIVFSTASKIDTTDESYGHPLKEGNETQWRIIKSFF